MRALIDANIILDVLQDRKPHVQSSSIIWKLCETEQLDGYISSLTFANLVYVMRKSLVPKQIKEVFEKLHLIFSFADLTASDLAEAAAREWTDFEDALQSAAAQRIHASYIITRNEKDFRDSSVPALSPDEFLEKWKENSRPSQGPQALPRWLLP